MTAGGIECEDVDADGFAHSYTLSGLLVRINRGIAADAGIAESDWTYRCWECLVERGYDPAAYVGR